MSIICAAECLLAFTMSLISERHYNSTLPLSSI